MFYGSTKVHGPCKQPKLSDPLPFCAASQNLPAGGLSPWARLKGIRLLLHPRCDDSDGSQWRHLRGNVVPAGNKGQGTGDLALTSDSATQLFQTGSVSWFIKSPCLSMDGVCPRNTLASHLHPDPVTWSVRSQALLMEL